MYSDFFGFKDTPFSIAPDPRYLYLSEKHREALAHLVYGISDHGGFIVLTGEVGTGKTTVCRCLLQQLPSNVDVAYIINPRQTSSELLRSVCTDLHIPHEADDAIPELVDRLNEFLLQNHAKGRNTILIIDEAQNLSKDVLEQLRLLTNLETNDKKLMQVMLIGQPELNAILSDYNLRQLSQRITARYHLSPLNLIEVIDYVHHRLFVAGCRESLFMPSAIKRIHRLTGGVPRLINVLCDRSLLVAYVDSVQQVTPVMVETAYNELHPKVVVKEKPKSFKERLHAFAMFPWVRLSVVAMCAVVMIALGVNDYPSKGSLFSDKATQSSLDESGYVKLTQPINFADLSQFSGYELDGGFRDLLAIWNIAVDPIESLQGDLCQRYPLPETHSCFLHENNFSELVAHNRPAIVSLYEQYFILVGVESDRAILKSPDDFLSLSIDEFNREWKGKAWWIAEISPGVRFPLVLGAKDYFVSWINSSLTTIYNLPQANIELSSETLENSQWLRQDGMYSFLYSRFQNITPKDSFLFDERLVDLVRRFQKENNIEESGMVDVSTVLRIQDRLGYSQVLEKMDSNSSILAAMNN